NPNPSPFPYCTTAGGRCCPRATAPVGGQCRLARALPLQAVGVCPCGLTAGSRPLRLGRKRNSRPVYKRQPLWLASLAAGGLTSLPSGCPCRGLGHGQPPLHTNSMQVAAPRL
ncbi:hypothetical protein BHM03_00061568, partial [Ensete ventricosum]